MSRSSSMEHWRYQAYKTDITIWKIQGFFHLKYTNKMNVNNRQKEENYKTEHTPNDHLMFYFL